MIEIEKKIIFHNNSSLHYYISPWDSDIFGYKVLNIDKLICEDDAEDLIFIIEKLENFCKQEDVKVIVWKMESTNSDLISLLQDKEYKYIEMSVVPYINPQLIDERKYMGYCFANVRKAEIKDIRQVKRIARLSFKDDRFHKDSNFENTKADERYSRWVENSFRDGEDIYLITYENNIAGFFILKIYHEEKYAAMRLGCISPEYQGKKLGLNINANIILKLREDGINLLDSPISISNLGIFNLYVSMGFKFKEQKICFHKWLEKSGNVKTLNDVS